MPVLPVHSLSPRASPAPPVPSHPTKCDVANVPRSGTKAVLVERLLNPAANQIRTGKRRAGDGAGGKAKKKKKKVKKIVAAMHSDDLSSGEHDDMACEECDESISLDDISGLDSGKCQRCAGGVYEEDEEASPSSSGPGGSCDCGRGCKYYEDIGYECDL